MTRGYRLLIKSARTVHIYTTLTGLLLILFFAFTGFVLNHEDWFQLGEPAIQITFGHEGNSTVSGQVAAIIDATTM